MAKPNTMRPGLVHPGGGAPPPPARRGSSARRPVRGLVGALAVMLILLAGRGPARAQTPEPVNRAGLVVQHGDGALLTRCVAFTEDEITGEELVRRAGLSVTMDPTMGFGLAVCKLDSEGCDYPREKCWCKCQGNPCVYWVYAHLRTDGTWQLAGIGASARRIRHGDVDGWAWGPGTPSSGTTPPPITFEAICGDEMAQGELTASPEPVQGEQGAPSSPTRVAGSETQPTETASAPPVSEPVQREHASDANSTSTPLSLPDTPASGASRPSIAGTTRSSQADAPLKEPPPDAIEQAEEAQAPGSTPGEVMERVPAPGRSVGGYAVFAGVVLALGLWLGFMQMRR